MSLSDAAGLDCLADISRFHGRVRPDAVAMEYRGRITTFGEIDVRASRVANGLITAGQGPGARIGYIGKNLDLFWDVVLGSFKSITVPVTFNWRLAPPELQFVVADAACEVLFVGQPFYEVVEQILPQLPQLKLVVAMDGCHSEWPDFAAWRDKQSTTDPMLPSSREDDVLQVYTSGTTGLPKGVVLTNSNFIFNFRNPSPHVPTHRYGDVILIAMPFFHVAGLGMGVTSLAHGTKGIILPDVDPQEILRVIPEKGVTHATLVPAVILALTQQPSAGTTDFSSLKRITYGGSPIPEATLTRATALLGCDFMQAYGLTETTGGPVTNLPPTDHVAGRGKLRSCGIPAPNREVRVVDGQGRSLPTGEVGEIVIRSGCVMKGYWNRPEATAEAIDAAGWFRSGDAGYFDEDGYLYIHDRIREMIVSGGENIYPAEVENALAGHPAIRDVAAIGVPDEYWGEAVKAVVVLRDGYVADPAEIIAYARERIAGYKLPKTVDFVAEIPRNPSGKILRRNLRRPYWEGRDRQVN